MKLILFGSSVNRGNAIEYLKDNNVNGLFIGHSAGALDKFEPIITDIEKLIQESESFQNNPL